MQDQPKRESAFSLLSPLERRSGNRPEARRAAGKSQAVRDQPRFCRDESLRAVGNLGTSGKPRTRGRGQMRRQHTHCSQQKMNTSRNRCLVIGSTLASLLFCPCYHQVLCPESLMRSRLRIQHPVAEVAAVAPHGALGRNAFWLWCLDTTKF